MKLKDLLNGVKYEVLQGNTNKNINGLEEKSGKIKKGFLFICLEGKTHDGHKYINDAIKNGASAICVSKDIPVNNKNITVIKVKDTRDTMSDLAANFYGKNFNFKFIGVTGTNGKTTITFMLKSVLKQAGFRVGIIGTSGIFLDDEMLRGEDLTTPDPIEMFKMLNIFNNEGVDFVIAEVSAHALYLRKNRGIMTDIAIFTNLTEDHLDFFNDMQNYGEAKKLYFKKCQAKLGIVNIDDKVGRQIAEENNIKIITTSKENIADFCAKKINLKNKTFVLFSQNSKYKIKLTMTGIYNVENALLVIATASTLGIKQKHIIRGLKLMPEIAGRFNIFDFKNHGRVILDFAHTPDGLEKILNAARVFGGKKAKIISVFGCGGNRDRAKRPIMGKISGTIANYTIISIDNPRYEEPYSVMNDIAEGIKQTNSNFEIIMPREKAIERAIELSTKNDIIVVSGKGVEPYYEVNGIKHPYNEADVIRELQKKYRK